VPDFPVDKRPDYRSPEGAEGMDAISGDEPFMMLPDGRGWLYAPAGLVDGPMPTHYEPYESPVQNALYPDLDANPAMLQWNREDNPKADLGDPEYPSCSRRCSPRSTRCSRASGASRTAAG
jgi:formate dehydrogenase major subunit